MVKRLDDWPSRLADIQLTETEVPFQWGVSDCALFAADVVEAMTGVDPAARWRGKYKTPRGSMRFGKGDPANVVEKIASENHWTEIVPAFAQRGDLVSFDAPTGPALGIIASDPRYIMSKIQSDAPPHIVLIPRRGAVAIFRAWRI